MVQNAYKWTMQKAIDLSISATAYAKELGLYTVFFPIDASRAEINWFLEMIKKVATEGHMDALAMVDTMGGLAPSTIPYLIKKSQRTTGQAYRGSFSRRFRHGRR
jgi:isopropylmalate/homocitrate/citramalate synthase